MGASDWAILIALSVLWGGSFFFNELTLVDFSPLSAVWLRVTIAALCLWLIVGVQMTRQGLRLPRTPAFWFSIALMGLLNNAIPFSLIVWGQQSIGSGLASILNATTPLFTVLVAGVFLSDERIAALKLFGVLVGFSGVVLMIGPQHLQSLGGTAIAQIAVLGAALCYAFATVFGRRFKAMGVPLLIVAAGQVSFASLWLLPLCVYTGSFVELHSAQFTAWASVFALGVFCTALAYLGYFKVLSSAGATNISLVTFLVPVSAILLGWAFLGESLNTEHYFGMLCIGIGLAAIDGRPIAHIKARIRRAP